MVKRFFIERRSWIFLFIVLHGLLLFIASVDPTIPFTSILYIVFLSVIIFTIFLVIRYRRETSFYRSLHRSDEVNDMLNHEASQPFEIIVRDHLLLQDEAYKSERRTYKQSLEREKDEMMAWIHEVKTPLTTMQLMIERLGESQLKQQLMVEWLRIDLLLDQQLHQKRIPFIENDYSIKKLNLQPIITAEIKNLQSWCMQKGIGFDVSFMAKEVLSDETWLRFIVRQLITNAVKYSERTDIIIKSGYVNEQVQLMIKDRGQGISERDLPRIFEKGFTSTSDERDQSATGMGLYLVQKVATHLSITIDVASTLGEGTTLYVTFPKQNDFVHLLSM